MVYFVEEPDQTVENISTINESRSDIESDFCDIFPNTMESNKSERLIIMKESKPLTRCSVLYLGAAIPTPNVDGIDSIQEPLAKRYPVDGEDHVCGIEAWLSIDENGLQIQFLNDPTMMLYYPIYSLIYCASVRFIKQNKTNGKSSNGYRFVSLDDPEGDHIENAQNPPLFAINLRRTRHLPSDECHCFVTKTKYAALDLVDACFKAYHITSPEQDCSKAPLYFKISSDGLSMRETDRGIYIAPALTQEKVFNYQCSREAGGFFYKTDKTTVDCWLLSEHHKRANHLTSSEHSTSSHSSRSSNRQSRRRNHRKVPDNQRSTARSQFLSPCHTNDQLTAQSNNLYTPISNSSRVQHVKDKNSGRDAYVRWINNMPSIPEQLTQTSSYETPANSSVDHPIDKKLSTDISHLALKNESQKDTITYENKQVAKSSRPTQEKSKKKDQKHQPANDYIIERPKQKSSRKNLKHRQSRHNETQSSSPSKLIQSEYPTPIYAQEYYPTPTFSNQQQYYSNSSSVQPESNKSPYPQQSFSISPFKQQDFSTSSYTPQIFSFPINSNTSFNGKPLPQTGSYLYHNLQPYSLSNNPNSTTPYWFFTM